VSWRNSPPAHWARAVRRRVWRMTGRVPAYADGGEAFFDESEIERVRRTYFEHGSAEGGPWDAYRHAHLRLPAWFRHGLDPWSSAYAEQQQRLWSLITGKERLYDAAVDEKEFGWEGVDPIRRPGFYMRRDDQAITSASDHWIATGMILKHCALKAGDWALEYGAGFGQTALALARLGVNVDTVDISAAFCDFIGQQARHFDVALHPFQGLFGDRPRPDRQYRLIFFYESFHHCVEFMDVVPKLRDLLTDDGLIVLGGEPIVEKPNAAVPYPWGVRLHSEVLAVMRQTGWFELGFTEAFLFELFARSGFVGHRVDCEPSLFGRLHVFRRGPHPAGSR
jgi:SAM-dependent methyltransferase